VYILRPKENVFISFTFLICLVLIILFCECYFVIYPFCIFLPFAFCLLYDYEMCWRRLSEFGKFREMIWIYITLKLRRLGSSHESVFFYISAMLQLTYVRLKLPQFLFKIYMRVDCCKLWLLLLCFKSEFTWYVSLIALNTIKKYIYICILYISRGEKNNCCVFFLLEDKLT